MKNILAKIKSNKYLYFTVLFFACFVIIYIPFFVMGRGFISNIDTIKQHLPFALMNKQILASIFSGEFTAWMDNFRLIHRHELRLGKRRARPESTRLPARHWCTLRPVYIAKLAGFECPNLMLRCAAHAGRSGSLS